MRPTTAFGVAFMLVLVGSVHAQVPTTMVLRNGDRITGDLVDMGADFTMRVGGRDQHIAASDVALIDFVGDGQALPSTEISRVQSGQATVFLRGSGVVYATLYDIGGRRPLSLVFDTATGRRTLSSDEVSRIYFAVPPGAAMPDTTPKVDRRTDREAGRQPRGDRTDRGSGHAGDALLVLANQPWTPTGIVVRRGDLVSFEADGEIQLSSDPRDRAGSAGSTTGRAATRRAPLPRVPAGALIGRIGDGVPFAIGNQTQPLSMRGSGELLLGVNDEHCDDNSGGFRVRISTAARQRRLLAVGLGRCGAPQGD